VTSKVCSKINDTKNFVGLGISERGAYGGSKNTKLIPVIESIHKMRLPSVRSSNRRLECEGSQLARQRLRHWLRHHWLILLK
jgi:hypothetical protein